MITNPTNCSLVCSNYHWLRVRERDGWWQSTGRTSRYTAAALDADVLDVISPLEQSAAAVTSGRLRNCKPRGAGRFPSGDQLLRIVKQKHKSGKWQGLLPPAAGVDPEPAVMTQIGPAFDPVFHIWTADPVSTTRRETIFVGGGWHLNGAENVVLSEVIKNKYSSCNQIVIGVEVAAIFCEHDVSLPFSLFADSDSTCVLPPKAATKPDADAPFFPLLKTDLNLYFLNQHLITSFESVPDQTFPTPLNVTQTALIEVSSCFFVPAPTHPLLQGVNYRSFHYSYTLQMI